MLVIREKQFQALYRSQFLFWLSGHLQQLFPAQCAALGGTGLQEAIEHALDRAAANGFMTRELQTQFVDLMIGFGTELELEPWAREILENGAAAPDARMARLHEQAAALRRAGVRGAPAR